MGDVLHALPMVCALRQAAPKIRIGWVIEERWAPLLCAAGCERSGLLSGQRPLVDAVHAVDTKRWRKPSGNSVREIRDVFREIRSAEYEVALDVQGAMKSAVLAAFSGAETRMGFASPRERAATLFYSRTVRTTAAHIIEQNVALGAAVAGLPLAPAEVLLPHDDAAASWCARELEQRNISRFAILNPGAGWGAKQWPSERYAEVARELANSGVQSLINIGPGEEELGSEVVRLSANTAETIACSIAELIALTSRASLFVGGDTGPLHLAAALRVPVVGIFGPTDPARNGPYGTNSRVLRHATSNTSYSHAATFDMGLLAITAEEVNCAAHELLR